MEIKAGIATITSQNMIVIPKKAREKFQLREGQKLQVFMGENEVILAPVLPLSKLAGMLKGPKTGTELIAESRKNVSKWD